MSKAMNGVMYKCPKCKKTEKSWNNVKPKCYKCKKKMVRVS